MYETRTDPQVSQDAELAAMMEDAARALERLGSTPEQVLAVLADVHAEGLDRAYGLRFMHEVDRAIADQLHGTEG